MEKNKKFLHAPLKQAGPDKRHFSMTSSKVRDRLPPDAEAAAAAFGKRTSRPPPIPRPRRKHFDVLVEEFLKGVEEERKLFHQK